MNRIIQNGDGIDISLTRGDSLYAELTVKKDGKAYVPEEGDVIRFACKARTGRVVVSNEIPLETMLLKLKPSDTEGLPYGAYPYDIQLTTAGGDVDTFIRGSLILTEEVE